MTILIQHFLCEWLETRKEHLLLRQFHIDTSIDILGSHLSASGKCFLFCISILRPVFHQGSATLCLLEVVIFLLPCFNNRSVYFNVVTYAQYMEIKSFMTDVTVCLKSRKLTKFPMDSKEKEMGKVQRAKPHVQHHLQFFSFL